MQRTKDFEQETIPEVAAELNYDDLDLSKHAGRKVGFFGSMVDVNASVSPAGTLIPRS